MLYIFNQCDNGYIIVAGDDRVNNMILGYCEEGNIDSNMMPPALKSWLTGYAQEIASLRYMTAEDSLTTYRSLFDKDVAPLVEARWGQDNPYNAMCPLYDGKNRSATGCVATAVAQIMYHHKWPLKGSGKKEIYGITGNEIIDYGNTTYQWDIMTPIYSSLSTKEECDAVATLMYHVGRSVDMMYGDVSGAQTLASAQALATYWNYDKAIIHRDRQYYTLAQWERMIMDEIDNNRPILYHGQSPEGGHAFVLDGYNSNGYVHINWGWNGMSNGYFLLHALSPEKQGVGGFVGGYNSGQGAVFGIKPNSGNKSTIEITAQKLSITSGISYKIGSSISAVVTGLANSGWNTATFAIGYMLYDSNDNHVTTIKSSNMTINANSSIGSRNVMFTLPETLTDGSYKLYLAHTDAYDNWKHVAMSMNEQPYQSITIADGKATIDATNEGRLWTSNVVCKDDTLYSNLYTTFDITMYNTGAGEYHGPVYISIYESTGRFEQRRSDPIAISVPAGSTINASVPIKISLNKGEYALYVTNHTKEKLSDPYAIKIYDEPRLSELKVSNFVLTGTAQDCLQVSYTITNYGNSYTGTLRSWILYDNQQPTSSFDNSPILTIPEGESINCTQTWKFDDGVVGEKYICSLWYEDKRKGTMSQFSYENIPFTLTNPTHLIAVEASTINLYPNPATEYITVESVECVENISIYSLQGNRLIDTIQATIYVGNLPPGMYYAIVTTHNQDTITKFIIR